MKLAVFGTTGNVGQRVVAEALRRGHEVVGVVRDPEAVQSPDKRVRLVKRGSGLSKPAPLTFGPVRIPCWPARGAHHPALTFFGTSWCLSSLVVEQVSKLSRL